VESTSIDLNPSPFAGRGRRSVSIDVSRCEALQAPQRSAPMTRVLESANEKGTVPRARPLLAQSRPALGDARVAPAPLSRRVGNHSVSTKEVAISFGVEVRSLVARVCSRVVALQKPAGVA